MTKQKVRLVKPEPLIKEPDIAPILDMYAQFHTAYEVPNTVATQDLYANLIEEEHEEWVEDYYNIQAFEFEELKELADILYVTVGLAYAMGYKLTKITKFAIPEYYDYSITDLVSEIATGKRDKKTLNNLIYCLFGYADAMGWDLMEAFRRVHQSNMSKLGEDGRPIRREDGKVLKGNNYKPPFLEDLTDGK